jgi:uncharacterized protein (TIGR02996 family)
VTEDEAFVRAVVDGRGDEMPRLAYADWLDERDDPRGQYIRAEHAWVRTRRKKKTVVELAEAFDAVWVARVSRPPVGACCEHLRFVDCGPRVTAKKIAAAEKKLGCEFPAAYRAFLLNYNAGTVEPPELPDDVEEVRPVCKAAASFYALGGTFDSESGTGPGDVVAMAEYLRGEEMSRHGPPGFPHDRLIPLATPQWDFDIVFLGVGRKEFGKVYHLDNLQDHGLDRDNLTEVAATLPEFLAKLKPKWSRGEDDE